MLVVIEDVLTKELVAEYRKLLDSADWVDGKVTAGSQSSMVKNNLQLPESSEIAKKLGNIILDSLYKNPKFLSAALPLKVFPPLFNKYGIGQSFGVHVDNAIRAIHGTGQRIRTDLSCTLFLSEPDEYDGGELIIEDNYGAQAVKLPSGQMVLYPSSSLHYVTEVRRGARVSSFFWMQSMVRDVGDRALLFDLDQTIQNLSGEFGLEHPEVVRLTGIYHNLVRKWADS